MNIKKIISILTFCFIFSFFIFNAYTLKISEKKSESRVTTNNTDTGQTRKNIKQNTTQYVISNVVIYAYEKKIFEGTRDLTADINRILKTQTNTDIVFGNREKLLPLKPKGYYHEYDIVTPQWPYSNRGPERIILGGQGEIFYTADHYGSFVRLK